MLTIDLDADAAADGVPFNALCHACGKRRGDHSTDELSGIVYCLDNHKRTGGVFSAEPKQYHTRHGESVCRCDIKDLLSSGHSSSCGYSR